MRDRYWRWMGVRLLVGAAIVAWAASYLGAGGGEKEFQKTLDAMKQVHSFRVAYSATPPMQHNELLWDVDCNRDIVHQQSDYQQTSRNPLSEMKQDQTIMASQAYERLSDGSWSKAHFATGRRVGIAAHWPRETTSTDAADRHHDPARHTFRRATRRS